MQPSTAPCTINQTMTSLGEAKETLGDDANAVVEGVFKILTITLTCV